MVKAFLFLVASLYFINVHAASQILQEHLEAGKQAYRIYANKERHIQFTTSKQTQLYEVGDTKTFWRWKLTTMPPVWIQEPATCRFAGEHSYVFVADSEWEITMTQDDVDTVSHYLENTTLTFPDMGIVEMDTTYFGDIPDAIDGDPRVIFLYSALGSFQSSVFHGYFSYFNQMTETAAQTFGSHSNECEMLYMSCNPVDPTTYLVLSVLAHELQHLIHWGYDPFEEDWVDEGCAEFAMVLFGQPDPIISFPQNSNNNLIKWDQKFSDYVQVMLFFTYLTEHYGGPSFITQLVANPAHGVLGINNTLAAFGHSNDFVDVLLNWTVANFVDDIQFLNGEFGYEILDLPDFYTAASYSQLPVETSNTLQACAAHYYELPIDFTSFQLNFTPTDGLWNINLITFENNIAKELKTIDIDSSFIMFQPESYNLTRLILVVTNKEISYSSSNYSFSVTNTTDVTSAGITKIDQFKLNSYPNPFNVSTAISFEIPADCYTTVNIYNIKGELAAELVKKFLKKGNYNFHWNATDQSSGTYIIRLKTGREVINKKCILLK